MLYIHSTVSMATMDKIRMVSENTFRALFIKGSDSKSKDFLMNIKLTLREINRIYEDRF